MPRCDLTSQRIFKNAVQRYDFFWNLQKKTKVFYKKTQIFVESVLFWGYFRIFAN